MSCARDAAAHMKKVSKSVPFRIWTPLMMCVVRDELTRSTHFQKVCAALCESRKKVTQTELLHTD